MADQHKPGDDIVQAISRFLPFFLPASRIRAIEILGNGTINDTYRLHLEDQSSVVCQQINQTIFPEPSRVADNVWLVTEHLRKRKPAAAFRLIQTIDGLNSYRDTSGRTWRMLEFIEKSVTYETVTSEALAFEGGKILGRFHRLLADFDPSLLTDPLPGFHDLPRYCHQYRQARDQSDPVHSRDLQFCLDEADRRLSQAGFWHEISRRKVLQQRVIHGDPKIANMLFEQKSDDGLMMIDLDTVSSGLLTSDLGDCLRSFCNSGGEQHEAPEDTRFVLDRCRAVLLGYHRTGARLSEPEKRLIFQGVRLLTYELGLRFLTDHLLGNRYFKVSRPDENLNRALCQFYLLISIERQQDEIERICLQI